MTTESEEKCGNCRFVGAYRSRVEGALVCRLNPPVTVTSYPFDRPSQGWEFPPVRAEDWCGRYEAPKV